MISRPSTNSSKVGSDLLLSILSSTSGHIKVMVHSLLRPIKALKRPSHRPLVEADRLSELLPELRTVPILLIRNLIHLVGIAEHIVQHHGMNGCIGTLLTASLYSESLSLRWKWLCLWLWLPCCCFRRLNLMQTLLIILLKSIHLCFHQSFHHWGTQIISKEVILSFLTKPTYKA
jgi:hypothetical protein